MAGGGELPVSLAEACIAAGRPLFVIRLKGFADPAMTRFPGEDVGLAELGRCFALLKRQDCGAVCFAGIVRRPDFAVLKPDGRGLLALAGAVAASRKGDDALLRYFVSLFEKEGFLVEGADQVQSGLTLGPGLLGRHAQTDAHSADIALAVETAKAIGRLDVGQAAVVSGGVVLAVEAQEGTDLMLARCAALPAALLGRPGNPCGVLAKWPKPHQERRVDLPALGPATVEAAARAGLAGIVGEAGGVLVLQREAVIEAADRLGLFVVGL